VVADEPASQRVAGILSRRAWAVEAARDPRLALFSLAGNVPDLVILDGDLAGMDTPGALRRLRAQPDTRHLPVILLLASTGGSAVEALALGASDYLVRPFSGRELVARVTLQLCLAEWRATAEENDRFVAGEASKGGPEVERERSRLLTAAEEAREQAEAANQMKDEVLATLSHELRTPLNAIVGWVHLLRAGRLDEVTARRALETIDRNARIQAQLIADMLDTSRIMSGTLHVQMRSVEPLSILEAALATVQLAAEAKAIRLRLAVDPLAGPVLGDADRLQQVVWNLLANAIKFTPAGGHVEVALAREGKDAVLRITDDGVGIAPEFLPFIFDRFRQADPSPTRPFGGLGLGLAIVRHLAEAHGGAVTAESAGPGHGATFTFRLPLSDVAERAAAPAGEPALVVLDPALRGPSLEGVSVLLVDADRAERERTSALLSERGAEVVPASGAQEALELVKRLRPHVLLSVERAEADGHQLIRSLREMPPERGGLTPAAVLSDVAAPEDRLRSLLAGYQVHLARPVTGHELAAVTANLAGRTRDFL
jgi:signal transduction histidine kinase